MLGTLYFFSCVFFSTSSKNMLNSICQMKSVTSPACMFIEKGAHMVRYLLLMLCRRQLVCNRSEDVSAYLSCDNESETTFLVSPCGSFAPAPDENRACRAYFWQHLFTMVVLLWCQRGRREIQ